MLFYFTATGNCLSIARELDNNCISIPQALKEGSRTYEADVIGFVVPDYSSKLPKIVERFIEQNKFKANYVYFIATYGRYDCKVSAYAKEFCEANGLKVDYANSLLMVDNFLPVFDIEEELKIDKNIPKQLADIKADIAMQKVYCKPYTEDDERVFAEVGARDPKISDGSSLYIGEGCGGCGICAQVCPIGNIEIKDGKAVRVHETCEFCLACANLCPHKEVKLQYADRNPNARFKNENVSVKDIIDANKQI